MTIPVAGDARLERFGQAEDFDWRRGACSGLRSWLRLAAFRIFDELLGSFVKLSTGR